MTQRQNPESQIRESYFMKPIKKAKKGSIKQILSFIRFKKQQIEERRIEPQPLKSYHLNYLSGFNQIDNLLGYSEDKREQLRLQFLSRGSTEMLEETNSNLKDDKVMPHKDTLRMPKIYTYQQQKPKTRNKSRFSQFNRRIKSQISERRFDKNKPSLERQLYSIKKRKNQSHLLKRNNKDQAFRQNTVNRLKQILVFEKKQLYYPQLIEHLKTINPFCNRINTIALNYLIKTSKIVWKKAHYPLYKEDENYPFFYIILFGKVKLSSKKSKDFKICDTGQTLLEQIVLEKCLRDQVSLQSCYALIETCLMEIKVKDFQKLKIDLNNYGYKDQFNLMLGIIKKNYVVKNWLRSQYSSLFKKTEPFK